MVNFKPTEEQELVRETMSGFAREVLRPASREADEKGTVPEDLVARGWELGLVQSGVPEQFGGYGDARSAVTGTLLLEELAYGDAAITLELLAPRLVTIPLALLGTDAQRAQWLPRFATDHYAAAAAAFSEPRWDFDPTALATRAERQGGDYVLTGTKCLVPLADRAEVILVYASTADGMGAFLVERTAAGVNLGEREKNMGIKALPTFPVALEGVRIPRSSRLGGDDADVTSLINASRVAVAALATGIARA